VVVRRVFKSDSSRGYRPGEDMCGFFAQIGPKHRDRVPEIRSGHLWSAPLRSQRPRFPRHGTDKAISGRALFPTDNGAHTLAAVLVHSHTPVPVPQSTISALLFPPPIRKGNIPSYFPHLSFSFASRTYRLGRRVCPCMSLVRPRPDPRRFRGGQPNGQVRGCRRRSAHPGKLPWWRILWWKQYGRQGMVLSCREPTRGRRAKRRLCPRP
jgi:hypothetical protein